MGAVFPRIGYKIKRIEGEAMLTIPTGLDLETRLSQIARRLGKTPEECALAALKAWIEDNEEALAHAQRLGGDGAVRLPDGFYD
jgi:hypothetical protein